MRPIDAEMLKEELSEAIKDAPLYIQATVDQYIDEAPTLTPPNDPLSIEQLREMDGEPVFVVIDDGIEPLKMWALVDYIAEEQCLTLTNNLGGRSQYYTADDLEIYHITAYRRPPEGEA